MDASALAGPGLIAPPLSVGADLFAIGAVTSDTLGDQAPTVIDDGSLVSPAPSDDYDLTTASVEDEEHRIDLLFSAVGLLDGAEVEDELSWLRD